MPLAEGHANCSGFAWQRQEAVPKTGGGLWGQQWTQLRLTSTPAWGWAVMVTAVMTSTNAKVRKRLFIRGHLWPGSSTSPASGESRAQDLKGEACTHVRDYGRASQGQPRLFRSPPCTPHPQLSRTPPPRPLFPPVGTSTSELWEHTWMRPRGPSEQTGAVTLAIRVTTSLRGSPASPCHPPPLLRGPLLFPYVNSGKLGIPGSSSPFLQGLPGPRLESSEWTAVLQPVPVTVRSQGEGQEGAATAPARAGQRQRETGPRT